MKVHSLEDATAKQPLNFENTQKSLMNLHREAAITSTNRHKQEVAHHSTKINVRPINFTEGDYVFRGMHGNNNMRKPSLRWRGPYHIG